MFVQVVQVLWDVCTRRADDINVYAQAVQGILEQQKDGTSTLECDRRTFIDKHFQQDKCPDDLLQQVLVFVAEFFANTLNPLWRV